MKMNSLVVAVERCKETKTWAKEGSRRLVFAAAFGMNLSREQSHLSNQRKLQELGWELQWCAWVGLYFRDVMQDLDRIGA